MASENAPYEHQDGHEWRCEMRAMPGVDQRAEYSVLDHGYLHVVEYWGSDQRIIESARMSTDKGFLGWGPKCETCSCNVGYTAGQEHCNQCGGKLKSGDEKLLRYLYEHKHSTPFEFAGLTIEVQAPIMVFREWHRHRTQSYSEMSARYVQMPDLHYVPSVERIVASARKSGNKQASGGGKLRILNHDEEASAKYIRQLIQAEQQRIYLFYTDMISWGVSKEVARLDTPVSRYSRMRATANLRNWLAFMTLRMAPDAQFEIRQYAWCVADAIKSLFPRTYELFNEGVKPILYPDDVDTPEQAWYRGANHMREVFHAQAKLGDNDPLWTVEIPDYKAP